MDGRLAAGLRSIGADVRERLHGEAADEFHERGVEHLPRATVRVVGFLRLAEDPSSPDLLMRWGTTG